MTATQPRHDIEIKARYWFECPACPFYIETTDKRRIQDEAERHAFEHPGNSSVSYGAIQ